MQSSEIILKSQSNDSKLIALGALQNCVQTKWGILPDNEKAGIRVKFITQTFSRKIHRIIFESFIEQAIVETCKKTMNGDQSTKSLLTKMNTTLIRSEIIVNI